MTGRAARLLTGALLPAALARVYTGSFSGATFPFVGQFAFGTPSQPPGTAPYGTAVISYSYPAPQPNTVLLEGFTDKVWNPKASCTDLAGNVDVKTPLEPGTGGSEMMEVDFTQRASSVPPNEWFFALATNGCTEAGVTISYTLTIKQADGGQLSYEELGLPAVYGCFWAIALLILGAHIWAHYVASRPAFAPVIVRLVTLTLCLHMASDFFHLCYWAVIANTGIANAGLAVVGGLLRLGALSCLWVLGALVAAGYGISTFSFGSWRDRANWSGALILSTLIIINLSTTILYALSRNAPETASAAIGLGITTLLLTIGYIVWFTRRISATIGGESSLPKALLLARLRNILIASFVILPFAELLGVAIPHYEALRVVVGIDLFLMSVISGLLAFFLWPSRSQDCFRVFDASVDVLLGSEFASGGTDAAALDAAYAASSDAEYSAVSGGL